MQAYAELSEGAWEECLGGREMDGPRHGHSLGEVVVTARIRETLFDIESVIVRGGRNHHLARL